MYASVGLRPSTNGGYAVRTHEPLPLKALLGRDHLARTAYYDFTLGNSSPIPITITSAGVTYTGPAITAASAGFVDSIGASPGHEAGSVTVSRGADVNVRITLQLRACPANSAGAVSAVPSIRLHYRALGLTGTARLASRDPLELSCP
jgi:hypothetical protein